jgi:hypothetical protein
MGCMGVVSGLSFAVTLEGRIYQKNKNKNLFNPNINLVQVVKEVEFSKITDPM